MRLTTLLILATSLHLSAAVRAQQVTLNEQNTPLNKIFKKITDQTGMLFVYRDEWLKETRDVSISVHGAGLKDVLDICFTNQPFTYEIIDKMIVLKEKPAPPPQTSIVDTTGRLPLATHGRIVDSAGAPLEGASIRIKGTTKGAQSNVRGEFELKNIPEGTVLVVSYTGYLSKEITATGKNDNYHYVVLQRSQDELDATVIQAYGTTSRRFNVGSITTVDASTIEKQPVNNVLLALEGQAPGLAINATSGVPGSQVLVQVRGQNTISTGSNSPYASAIRPYDQPLFIIDGVPFSPQNNTISQLSSLAWAGSISGGISEQGGLSGFSNINPADIESISILKDADATSIYGTQGSNGVVLITTKKGKAGKTTFQLTANTGFNTNTRKVKLLNTPQYIHYREDAFAAGGITPSSNPYAAGYAPDLTIFDTTKYTDWEHVIAGKTSNNTDLHGTLSGGTINNTFLVAGGFTRSDYNFPGNFADQRLSFHSAFHHVSTDNRLTADFGMDYGYEQNNATQYGGSGKTLLAPDMPNLLDSAGNLVWTYKGVNLAAYQFYQFLKLTENVQNYNFNTTLRLGYKVLTGLNIGVDLGYNSNTSNEQSTDPTTSEPPQYPNPYAIFATTNFKTINIEPRIDYTSVIGNGVFSALVGGTYKKNLSDVSSMQGYGYANDNFLGSINGATQIYASGLSNIYRYNAGFGRLKYVYDHKYILSLTGRRDGSSNFGPGHQFGDFGSAGAGWIFSEEKAFKTALPVVSYGKLSGSYGTSGSDGVAAYMYQDFWKPVNGVPAFQGSQPNTPQNLYNPNYSWALKKSLNIAMDLGFFHDRVLLNATWYRDREGNQLAGYPLPAQSGFSQVLENLPANVQNSGWEFSATSTNIKTKHFTWATNFNITFNRNKLLSFPNLDASSLSTTYMIGKPTSEVIGYKFAGLNSATGLYQYRTTKGQDTTNPKYGLPAQGGDLAPIADREVKFMGGLGNTLSYRGFSLYVFIQFADQTSPNYMSTVNSQYLPGLTVNNEPVQVLDYWKKPGDQTKFQRLTTSYGRAYTTGELFSQSSGAYGDDFYARLKTVALSYSLPEAWLKKAHLHGCTIYANAQNLLTITNFKVGDPEQFGSFVGFPLQRIVVFGLNFNF